MCVCMCACTSYMCVHVTAGRMMKRTLQPSFDDERRFAEQNGHWSGRK